MAVELVGGAFLSSSLQYLFERLGSHEVLAYLRGKSKRCDLHELVGKLRIVLNSVLAVIEDAEQKQTQSKRVEAWLDMLQEAVFDAEDLLDAIETDSMQHYVSVKTEPSSRAITVRKLLRRKTLKAIFSRSGSSDSSDMEENVKKLLERLEYIAGQKDILGLEKGERKNLSWRLPSTSLVDETGVYGRDKDRGEMINLLFSDFMSCRKYCVIPIVGMGGLGKTTLAQTVFNDKKVSGYFELKAWVCVSEEFDVCRVTKSILEEITSDACNVEGLNSLQVKLKESLMGKKFLIVLDDVWCEKSTDLNVMCMPFKDGAQGSKIIVTTRSENVASIMATGQICRLQKLPDEACWQLFAKEASSGVNGNFITNQEIRKIGKEIVKKCKGLPLALKTLGGLLRSAQGVREWKRILESDIWDLGKDESDILPALKLSYHYLPSQLKRCFAYCSIFPKDYEFDKDELIRLWMAENLLEHPNNKYRRIEDVGDEYFNGLVSRSFFQISSTHESLSQETNTKPVFVMHVLIHDLAKSVSTEYCSHLEDDTVCEVNGKKARHLAYIARDGDPYGRFKNVLQASNLRTFLQLSCSNENRIPVKLIGDLIMKLRCLRVLSLSGYGNVDRLPDSIGELRHLRYLNLSNTKIFELPESVCKLFNLQTLKLYCCWYIKRLPKDMHRLINMRFLDIRDCHRLVEMPTQLSKLKNLQTLSTFIVGKDSRTNIGELRELPNLQGELCIQKLENVGNIGGARDEPNLADKKHLESLMLEWTYGSSDDLEQARDVLQMLSPSRTLKRLQIYGYPGKEFPNWLGSDSLRNVVSITLTRCSNCTSLPPLGQLPSLKSLHISYFYALVTVGSEFYGTRFVTKPFPSLETLKFFHMLSWERWFHEDPATFAVLKELEIISCRKLVGDLPSYFPSLTKLKIFYCPNITSSLPRMPNVHQVDISSCENMMQFESFTDVLRQMESCQCITLASCSSSIQIPVGCLPTNLKTLVIQECCELKVRFDRPHKSLEVLELTKSCSSLLILPLEYFPSLKELSIQELENLESLSMLRGLCNEMTSLSSLHISECPNFISFPKDGLPAPNLTDLRTIDCKKLKYLPEKMHKLLPSLKNLVIIECPNMESFPQANLPLSLYDVSISPCFKLIGSRKNWPVKRLQNLRNFRIGGSNADMESFPEEGLLPLTITSLCIMNFPFVKSLDQYELGKFTSLEELSIHGLPKLQIIPGLVLSNSIKFLYVYNCNELQTISEEFPNSLQCLVISDCLKLHIITKKELPGSLKELCLINCAELQIIPERGLPMSLRKLIIGGCPLLAEKCQKEKGEYWNEISHVYCIEIDDEIVS